MGAGREARGMNVEWRRTDVPGDEERSARLAAAIAENVAAVRREIAAACQGSGRDPGAVRLIAVTKSRGVEVLAPLRAAGVSDIAENRVERLRLMRGAIGKPGAGVLALHGIGRLQSRQLPEVAANADCVHGLDDIGHVGGIGVDRGLQFGADGGVEVVELLLRRGVGLGGTEPVGVHPVEGVAAPLVGGIIGAREIVFEVLRRGALIVVDQALDGEEFLVAGIGGGLLGGVGAGTGRA